LLISIGCRGSINLIEVRGGESGRHTEWNRTAYPFTPKTYPNDRGSTIDLSRVVLARNGQVGRWWIALTASDRYARRKELGH